MIDPEKPFSGSYEQNSSTNMSSEASQQDMEMGKGMKGSSENYSAYTKFVRRLRGEYSEGRKEVTLLQKCLAELIGTAIIVLTGVGVVNTAVFTGAQVGLWQVTVIWGFGICLAIMMTASVSGAHLNPAVSFAFALLRPDEFHPKLLLFYWLSQLIGGILGGLINYGIFRDAIKVFENKFSIDRGSEESVLSAMAFGEYFPNPLFQYSRTGQSPEELLSSGPLGWTDSTITPGAAFAIEAWGTGVLMFVILTLVDNRNTSFKNKEMAPFFIGFTVAVLMSLYTPFTQGGFNPARDFGPRLVALMLGWGEVAIPGPRNGFWIYIFGPLFGAPIGGALYDFAMRPPKLKN